MTEVVSMYISETMVIELSAFICQYRLFWVKLHGVAPPLQYAEGGDIGVLGGLQRSHSDHRQQHIPPILKIKTFYQGSESERIFSIF